MKIFSLLILLAYFISGCGLKRKEPDLILENQQPTSSDSNKKSELFQEKPEPTRQTSFECESTKEYVTVLNYLREENELIVPEDEARKISLQVSQGCDGAANRFIRISRLLVRSHVSGNDSVRSALKFVQKTTKEVSTFEEVFARCFLEEYLDMDIDASVSIAHSLSNEFDGDAQIARYDFRGILNYCLDNDEKFHLKKSECGRLAARIAKAGQNSKQTVMKAFKEGFEFLNSTNGPNLNIQDSLKMSEELVSISPKAVSNFKDAYAYAVSKSGLQMSIKDAIPFSKLMAEYTGPEMRKSN